MIQADFLSNCPYHESDFGGFIDLGSLSDPQPAQPWESKSTFAFGNLRFLLWNIDIWIESLSKIITTLRCLTRCPVADGGAGGIVLCLVQGSLRQGSPPVAGSTGSTPLTGGGDSIPAATEERLPGY